MFWIPGEPWGWIPYHLGVWHWSKKIGWVWLPGSMFAPAWATWDFYFGYACWRPWGLFDWMVGPYDAFGWSGFSYSGGSWAYASSRRAPGGAIPPTVTRKDQLKQPKDSPFPVPGELRRVLGNVTAAYRRGDTRVREDAEALPRHLVFVDRRDLASPAIETKALTWDRVPKAGPPADGSNGQARRRVDPQREAVRIFSGADGTSAVPRKVPAPPANGTERGGVRSLPPSPSIRSGALATTPPGAAPFHRFRDWNPDVRVARELGAHIEYSAARNEVRCPELMFSSRDREAAGGRAPHLTSRGIVYGPATSIDGDRASRPYSSSRPGSSGSSGATGPSGSSAAGGTSDRSSASSQGGESRAGGEGGRIKN
jgi:hypothetical protein